MILISALDRPEHNLHFSTLTSSATVHGSYTPKHICQHVAILCYFSRLGRSLSWHTADQEVLLKSGTDIFSLPSTSKSLLRTVSAPELLTTIVSGNSAKLQCRSVR